MSDGYVGMEIETGGGKYLRCKSGEVVQFHILSEHPKKILTHGFGKERLSCTGEGCHTCEEGAAPKQRWLINVWDRKGKAVKIFEFGPQIASQLKNIAEMLAENQQTVQDVDIRIKTEGANLDTEHFVNQVMSKDPLPTDLKLHIL